MKQFNTREEVLQDAIDYYWGKPERRCVKEHGTCSYIPQGESEGCAIGRLVSPEIAEELGKNGYGICVISQFEKLPEWMKVMRQKFWVKMQVLHDCRYFANKDVNKVQAVGKYLELDMSKITFPEHA
jgi:hypothetical protein